MATLNPYLDFNGNREQAFDFCKSVFGGEIAMPLSTAFRKAYFGILTDRSGIQWRVNFDETPQK